MWLPWWTTSQPQYGILFLYPFVSRKIFQSSCRSLPQVFLYFLYHSITSQLCAFWQHCPGWKREGGKEGERIKRGFAANAANTRQSCVTPWRVRFNSGRLQLLPTALPWSLLAVLHFHVLNCIRYDTAKVLSAGKSATIMSFMCARVT